MLKNNKMDSNHVFKYFAWAIEKTRSVYKYSKNKNDIWKSCGATPEEYRSALQKTDGEVNVDKLRELANEKYGEQAKAVIGIIDSYRALASNAAKAYYYLSLMYSKYGDDIFNSIRTNSGDFREVLLSDLQNYVMSRRSYIEDPSTGKQYLRGLASFALMVTKVLKIKTDNLEAELELLKKVISPKDANFFDVGKENLVKSDEDLKNIIESARIYNESVNITDILRNAIRIGVKEIEFSEKEKEAGYQLWKVIGDLYEGEKLDDAFGKKIGNELKKMYDDDAEYNTCGDRFTKLVSDLDSDRETEVKKNLYAYFATSTGEVHEVTKIGKGMEFAENFISENQKIDAIVRKTNDEILKNEENAKLLSEIRNSGWEVYKNSKLMGVIKRNPAKFVDHLLKASAEDEEDEIFAGTIDKDDLGRQMHQVLKEEGIPDDRRTLEWPWMQLWRIGIDCESSPLKKE